MHEPWLILRHSESFSSESLESWLETPCGSFLLLLPHLFIHFFSLLLDKLSCFLEELFEVLLCLFCVEPLLLLITIVSVLLLLLLRLLLASTETSPSWFRVRLSFVEGIVPFSFGWVTQYLICSCQFFEFFLIHTVVTVWVVELSQPVKSVLDFLLRSSLRNF